MNKEEAKEQAQLMLDWANGDLNNNDIECKNIDVPNTHGWVSLRREDPLWNFSWTRYRRKPKPLEMWCVVLDGGSRYNFQSEETALKFQNTITHCSCHLVHLREVDNE